MMLVIVGMLLKLLIRFLRQIGRLLWQCIVLLGRGLRYLIRAAVAFWNDNSTQEMLGKMRRGCATALRTALRVTLIVLKYIGLALWTVLVWLYRALIWTAKATWHGILHLRPTVMLIGRWMGRAAVAVGHFMVRMWRGVVLFVIRRKRAYNHFRRNKGFKGLMLDIIILLRAQFRSYMDDNETETATVVQSYDESIIDNINRNGKSGARIASIIEKIKHYSDNL